MKFEDDAPAVCGWCKELIHPGEIGLMWRKRMYCSEDCVKEAVFQEYANEVETYIVLSASDKQDIYTDMYE